MLIRYKLLLGFLVIVAITLPNGVIGYLKVEQSLSQIENDLALKLQDLKAASRFNDLASNTKYYDEVLTNAARNYALTWDERWLNSYYDAEHALDMMISEALNLGDDTEMSLSKNIHSVHQSRIAMEHMSLEHKKSGNHSEAIAILESPEYWQYKAIYFDMLDEYAKSRGLEYGGIFDISTSSLEYSIESVQIILAGAESLLYFGIPTVLLIAVFLCYLIIRSISDPLNALKQAVTKISRGDYDVDFPKERNDEIGDLARKMETMLTSFKTSLETELQLTVAKERLKTEKLTTIGELAARIAHDLRNPLSVIKNTCEIMKMQYGSNDAQISGHISKMENSIQRMSHQIDDVLNFIRTTPIKKGIVSLKDLVERTIDELDVPSSVTVELPSNDEKINCDEQKMRTVISNIVLNSIQAMDGNGVLTIKIRGYTKFASISISDTGPGIPDDLLSKVFEPLFTTKQTGTGLGLSSCKSIVEQHNGTIDVKNSPTTFTITLPRL